MEMADRPGTQCSSDGTVFHSSQLPKTPTASNGDPPTLLTTPSRFFGEPVTPGTRGGREGGRMGRRVKEVGGRVTEGRREGERKRGSRAG